MLTLSTETYTKREALIAPLPERNDEDPWQHFADMRDDRLACGHVPRACGRGNCREANGHRGGGQGAPRACGRGHGGSVHNAWGSGGARYARNRNGLNGRAKGPTCPIASSRAASTSLLAAPGAADRAPQSPRIRASSGFLEAA